MFASDPVTNNRGWRYWFFGEGVGATAALMLVIYFYFIPWEPRADQGVEIFCLMLLFGHFLVWYANAQSSGLVSATDRANLADDQLPVRAMILSMMSVGVCVIALVLAAFVWTLHFTQGFTPGVVGLSWAKVGIITAVVRLCWGDLTLNATMLGRTQRYRPEYGAEGPHR